MNHMFEDRTRTNRSHRTAYGYNLDLLNLLEADTVALDGRDDFTEDGYPVLEPTEAKPEKLIGFDMASKANPKDAAVHFFLDDFRFERVWSDPLRYALMLEPFEAVFTPDFSLYLEMPEPMQRWNIYRSRAIGRIWQDCGLCVVPTLRWATEQSFAWCFAGVPKRSTVALSTVGLMDCEEGISLFQKGANEAMRQLEPSRVLAYGNPCDFDSGTAEVIWYPHSMAERFAKIREDKKTNNQKVR